MNNTYLTTDELAKRIKYEPRTIRQTLKDSVLIEGVHYFRPFQGRKILYIWERVEEAMLESSLLPELGIPMASGGICNG